MNLTSFKNALSQSEIEQLEISLKSGRILESHFHITEIGKVTKDFVDCGGVLRKTETCLFQTLVANDTDHRLSPRKLLGIIEKAELLGLADDIEIELEIQGSTIETYLLADTTKVDRTLRFNLESKNTACLAPDKCGLEVVSLGGPSQPCCGEGEC